MEAQEGWWTDRVEEAAQGVQPLTDAPGYTQFRGQRYCPGQIPRDKWLAEKRQEAKSDS